MLAAKENSQAPSTTQMVVRMSLGRMKLRIGLSTYDCGPCYRWKTV